MFVVLLTFFGGLVGACDQVYVPDEIAAKRKFEAIKKGQSRESVVKALGAPTLELVADKARTKYEYVDRNSKRWEIPRYQDLPADAPPELRFAPRSIVARVLVYSADTVFGYIGLNDENVVSFVDVRIS